MTLFALYVPMDLVCRLWDVYAFEGDPFIIRAAVAVMGVLESRLYGTKEEVVELLGWGDHEKEGGAAWRSSISGKIYGVEREWKVGHEDEFMAKVRSAGKQDV